MSCPRLDFIIKISSCQFCFLKETVVPPPNTNYSNISHILQTSSSFLLCDKFVRTLWLVTVCRFAGIFQYTLHCLFRASPHFTLLITSPRLRLQFWPAIQPAAIVTLQLTPLCHFYTFADFVHFAGELLYMSSSWSGVGRQSTEQSRSDFVYL